MELKLPESKAMTDTPPQAAPLRTEGALHKASQEVSGTPSKHTLKIAG